MSVEDNIGGYPVEWFVKAPSENFKCGICLDVLKNPRQCINGHNFCHSCISLALQKNSACPTCKTVMNSERLCISLSLRNVIDEMFVKCCHDGCKWTGTLEQSVKHFKLCSMRSVPCPLHAHRVCTDKKCTGSIKLKEVHNHMSDGNKSEVADAMLIMAETIAYQKKEIELLCEFILSGKTKIHKIDNESTFVGSLKDGKKEGFGLFKTTDTTYSGHFNKGEHYGFGVLRGSKVVKAGMWENGKLNGQGMLRQPRKGGTSLGGTSLDTYIGDFKDNHEHGLGRWMCGDTGCFGSFKNGAMHGEVSCPFLNHDDVLVGTYEKGKRCIDLPCTLTAGNGSVFVGILDSKWQFIEGKFTTADGVVYEGTFCDNANQFRLNGTGTITYTDGSIYTGEFRSGLKHGKGSLVDRYVVPSAAEGDVVNDKLVPSYFSLYFGSSFWLVRLLVIALMLWMLQ